MRSFSTTEDGLRLWDSATGKEIARHVAPITCAAFTRDGRVVLAAEYSEIRIGSPWILVSKGARVAYADGHLSEHERHVLWRVADLLQSEGETFLQRPAAERWARFFEHFIDELAIHGIGLHVLGADVGGLREAVAHDLLGHLRDDLADAPLHQVAHRTAKERTTGKQDHRQRQPQRQVQRLRHVGSQISLVHA